MMDEHWVGQKVGKMGHLKDEKKVASTVDSRAGVKVASRAVRMETERVDLKDNWKADSKGDKMAHNLVGWMGNKKVVEKEKKMVGEREPRKDEKME